MNPDPRRYVPYRGDNTPPYLYTIANELTDAPSALSFLAELEAARAEYEAMRWVEAHALGIV